MFASGRRSYVLQYRAKGRSRRFTIGLQGVFTPEKARQEARVQLGRIAGGDDPAGERELDRKAITVRGLCEMYLRDLHAGLILGKGQRPKKASTIATDSGRITRHLIPLLGTRRVRDLTKPEINSFMMDITAGKTRLTAKTKKLRGKSIVRGGAGTTVRTIGPLGGILTYAVEQGIIETNPTHGLRKQKYKVRTRRLSEREYGTLGKILRGTSARNSKFATTASVVRLIALTGCRRGEIIGLKWSEVDLDGSCLRLQDTKEGASVRPIGLSAVEFLRCSGRRVRVSMSSPVPEVAMRLEASPITGRKSSFVLTQGYLTLPLTSFAIVSQASPTTSDSPRSLLHCWVIRKAQSRASIFTRLIPR